MIFCEYLSRILTHKNLLPEQDLGPHAKVTRWAEHLTPAPPVGFATGAPLPTRRAALRQLLELALAAAASLAPQVSKHYLGFNSEQTCA